MCALGAMVSANYLNNTLDECGDKATKQLAQMADEEEEENAFMRTRPY